MVAIDFYNVVSPPPPLPENSETVDTPALVALCPTMAPAPPRSVRPTGRSDEPKAFFWRPHFFGLDAAALIICLARSTDRQTRGPKAATRIGLFLQNKTLASSLCHRFG